MARTKAACACGIIHLSIRNTNRHQWGGVGLDSGDALGGLKGLSSGRCSMVGRHLVVKDVAARRHMTGRVFTARRSPSRHRRKGELGTCGWKTASTTNRDNGESS